MVYMNYFYAYLFAFAGIVINIYLFLQFLSNDLILTPTIYLILFLALYFTQRIAINNYRPLIRKYIIVMELNYVLTGVLVFSSWVYYIWSFTFFSAELVSKSTLLLLGMGFAYLFIMVKRAMYTMTKKIKNPRINETKPLTYFERIKDADEKLSSDKPYFVLGVDIDTELDD